MKVSFLFNGQAKIILTPESKRDETLMIMARDYGPATIKHRNDNSLEIDFEQPEKECLSTQGAMIGSQSTTYCVQCDRLARDCKCNKGYNDPQRTL